MAASAVALLSDPELRRRIGVGGRNVVTWRYCSDRIVPQYEKFYREILDGPAAGA